MASPSLRKFAHPLKLNHPLHDYNALIEAVGSAEVVLIGEASHGTREFYRERALITQRLITEKGFTAVCAEADYTDAYTVNSFIQDLGPMQFKNAADSLRDFKRFPLWMWRNEVMLKFVDWCHRYNKRLASEGKSHYERVSFHGMDLYSLHASAEAVIGYLTNVDTKAAAKARQRYGCFERFGNDTMRYAFATRYGVADTCEKEVVQVLRELLQKRAEYMQKALEGFRGPQEQLQWVAEMNAELVKDAESYYRCMLQEDVKTWNLRDEHMVRTIEHIKNFLSKGKGSPAKMVVWAHNSHLGDARETEMGMRRGELNVGQLCRQHFGMENTFNIGFTTYTGSVTAAHEWDTPGLVMKVNPGRSDSYEGYLHAAAEGLENYLLIFRRVVDSPGEQSSGAVARRQKQEVDEELTKRLASPKLERAIGVIYKPDTERWSHYFTAHLSKQFDAVIHIDRTTAIRPMDHLSHFPDEEENVPEMYPFGV